MRKRLFTIFLTCTIFLLGAQITQADIIEGDASSDIHVETHVGGSGSVSTHIETNVNGKTNTYQSNSAGDVYLHTDSQGNTTIVTSTPSTNSANPTLTSIPKSKKTVPLPQKTRNVFMVLWGEISQMFKSLFQ